MARLTRCFSLLIFSLVILAGTQAHALNISKLITTEWFKPGADCLNRSLSFIKHKNLAPEQEAKLVGAANYNDQIFKQYDDLNPNQWDKEVIDTIDHFAAYDASFDAVSFKRWIKENPVTVENNTTVGEYLKTQNEAFLKKYPEGKIEDIINEIPDELRGIAKVCNQDIKCHEKKIGALITSKLNKTCVAKFKAVIIGCGSVAVCF